MRRSAGGPGGKEGPVRMVPQLSATNDGSTALQRPAWDREGRAWFL